MNARTGHDPGGFTRKFIHINITDHFRDKISIRLKQDRIAKSHFTGGKKGTLTSKRSKQNTTMRAPAPEIRRIYSKFKTSDFILMCIGWNVRSGYAN
jgi:hypothetical protein